jgi:Acyl-coenzyme A:6-aminopenicillanic acid acyl-transferase
LLLLSNEHIGAMRYFITVCAAFWCLSIGALYAGEAQVTTTTDGGQFAVRERLNLLSLIGDAATLGRQAGELVAPQTQAMITLLGLLPGLTRQALITEEHINMVPERYRQEIDQWARAAHCDPMFLLRANLSVDVLCTAVVCEPEVENKRPLMIARNMDFAPAQWLGPQTMVIARRPTGRRANVAVSWPGYVGIVSGMNDAGVVACLLLNHAAQANRTGDGLGFLLRDILEQAGDINEAITHFSAAPIASSNYVLLADATTAAIVWWEGERVHRVDPTKGWLLCTNARFDDTTQRPNDQRGRHALALVEKVENRLNPDAERMKRLLTATYMPQINTQAMIFVPSIRSLQLATYGPQPAALSKYKSIDVAALLAGAQLAEYPVHVQPAVEKLPHYFDKPLK